MSTNRTENYQLNAWGAEDEERLAELNENFGKLDETLAGKIVMGTYTGNGMPMAMVELGFTPVAVFCIPEKAPIVNGSSVNGGLALAGEPVRGRENLPVVEIVEGGFRLYYEYSGHGTIGANSGTQHYLAFQK